MKPVKPTSKEGHEHIKPYKPTHYERILQALERLKVGGTYEEISLCAHMRPDQVWKRLSELRKDEKIFETGTYRKLSSGLNGTVWQLVGKPVVKISDNPKTEKEQAAHNKLEQLKLLL